MTAQRIAIAKKAEKLMRVFGNAGYTIYLAGGAVRDSLLGCSAHDFDFATDAKPEEMTALARTCGIEADARSARFGTVIFTFSGERYEITTFRREAGGDGRHPDEVIFTDSARADATRRDLTVNALFADADGNVIDYTGGADDIRHGIIRFVGDAFGRIAEDHLRILRLFRFAGRYGFSIAPDALSAAKKACSIYGASLFGQVSADRIRKELAGILSGDASVIGLAADAGLLDALLLAFGQKRSATSIASALRQLESADTLTGRLAVFSRLAADPNAFLGALGCSTKQIRQISLWWQQRR